MLKYDVDSMNLLTLEMICAKDLFCGIIKSWLLNTFSCDVMNASHRCKQGDQQNNEDSVIYSSVAR